jgi:hypothetical protein
MRFNKRVALSGEAPICPIELSDLVVGMNHLGWAPLSHGRFVLRRNSPLSWPQRVLNRFTSGRDQDGTRRPHVSYWLEAEIDDSGGQRTLALHGRVPLSDRRKIDALMDALRQGRRWLTREGPLG